jgi:2-oxoglutarate ferredoxin oxidoreductase subunit alpha
VKQKTISNLVVHFAGDSGDGIQVTGSQFAQNCADFGNDVRTLPDFPAEIRAPQGTLAGVSGFQMSFSDEVIYTPGDFYDILVAFNVAAFKKTVENLKPQGLLVIDDAKFSEKECKKLDINHQELFANSKYKIITLPMTALTLEALKDLDLTRSSARKCKNFFALGVICWLTHRSLEPIKTWIKNKFTNNETLVKANIQALRTGYDYAVTVELFSEQYNVSKAEKPPGQYKQITGNDALGLGAIAASSLAKIPLFMSGYPITPASDILHYLAKMSDTGVTTFQAEDEMAAIGAALGASFGGHLALTSTSGPGMDLKAEGLGLAVMTELPLVVVNVQRAGPSTGMPTKVEQSDLLSALYGRHGECPLPVFAPATPGECFMAMVEAFRVAVKYMTPVIILSDANLANSMESWRIPDINELPEFEFSNIKSNPFVAYKRDNNLAREWVSPGTKDKIHRIGGLEKDFTGNISYEPENHEEMVNTRALKIANIAIDYPELIVEGAQKGECLLIGWGSTYGSIKTAFEHIKNEYNIGFLQLRNLNPLPRDLENILSNYNKIVVIELNSGQLCKIIRSEYLVDAKSLTQVQGKPFSAQNLIERITTFLEQDQCLKPQAIA